MKQSELFAGSSVTFPDFTGERVYMQEFTPGGALPIGLERWQVTVDAMLRGVRATGPAYLMIDQAEVCAGSTHRRPGLHVDGYWQAASAEHGNQPPRHSPANAALSMHGGHRVKGAREALIIAASVEGCEAFEGEWDGVAGAGGDCSAVPIASLTKRKMAAGVAWIGEAGSLLHSAIELPARALRTVVRLNVQGWAA